MLNYLKIILPEISLVIINQFFPVMDSFRRYKKAISVPNFKRSDDFYSCYRGRKGMHLFSKIFFCSKTNKDNHLKF